MDAILNLIASTLTASPSGNAQGSSMGSQGGPLTGVNFASLISQVDGKAGPDLGVLPVPAMPAPQVPQMDLMPSLDCPAPAQMEVPEGIAQIVLPEASAPVAEGLVTSPASPTLTDTVVSVPARVSAAPAPAAISPPAPSEVVLAGAESPEAKISIPPVAITSLLTALMPDEAASGETVPTRLAEDDLALAEPIGASPDNQAAQLLAGLMMQRPLQPSERPTSVSNAAKTSGTAPAPVALGQIVSAPSATDGRQLDAPKAQVMPIGVPSLASTKAPAPVQTEVKTPVQTPVQSEVAEVLPLVAQAPKDRDVSAAPTPDPRPAAAPEGQSKLAEAKPPARPVISGKNPAEPARVQAPQMIAVAPEAKPPADSGLVQAEVMAVSTPQPQAPVPVSGDRVLARSAAIARGQESIRGAEPSLSGTDLAPSDGAQAVSAPAIVTKVTSVQVRPEGEARREPDLAQALPAEKADVEAQQALQAAPLFQPATHIPAALAKATMETVPSLTNHLISRLADKVARFDVQLHPADLGRVDVHLEIMADGRISGSMSFDTPQAAAELRSRADELTRSLQDAGFDMSGGLSFDVASDRGQGQGQSRQNAPELSQTQRGRAFDQAMSLADESRNSALDGALQAYQSRARSGYDIRI